MPSTTSHYGITYSLASDEVEKFPAEVSAVGAKRIDEVLYERFLSVQEHSSPFSAKSGELVKCTGAIVVTLPSVTANAIVGVLANNHGVEVERTGAAKIYGDFVEGESKIKLTGYQHVVLQSDGTNWYIIAGEPAGKSWGNVAENATINEGTSDFTVAKTETGVYTVTWNAAKPTVYAVVASPIYGTGGIFAAVSEVKTTSFQVVLEEAGSSVTRKNHGFTFVVLI